MHIPFPIKNSIPKLYIIAPSVNFFHLDILSFNSINSGEEIIHDNKLLRITEIHI